MTYTKDISLIKSELKNLFPDATLSYHNSDKAPKTATSHTFMLKLAKGKKVAIKLSTEYLDSHPVSEVLKHLQVNIFYIVKSNINKTIYLLKDFEIEIENSLNTSPAQ